jgi:hypothetical protein
LSLVHPCLQLQRNYSMQVCVEYGYNCLNISAYVLYSTGASLTDNIVKTSDGMLVLSSGVVAIRKIDVKRQMKELQCSIFKSSVMVIKVNFRRGVFTRVANLVLHFSTVVGSCSAALSPISMPASEPAIRPAAGSTTYKQYRVLVDGSI